MIIRSHVFHIVFQWRVGRARNARQITAVPNGQNRNITELLYVMRRLTGGATHLM